MSIDLHLADSAGFDRLPGAQGLNCIVTDGPAGVRFMGAKFDHDHGGRDAWIQSQVPIYEAGRRACAPGAWMLAWALPRTSHWTGTAIDDAGWEITDCITHLFGQGYPKSARTCLKPASEHWWLARNGGGGSLQIDASRVRRNWDERGEAWKRSGHSAKPDAAKIAGAPPGNGMRLNEGGSWPTNYVHSHCPECEERGARVVKGSAPASGPTLTGPSTSVARGNFSGVGSTPSYGEKPTIPAFDCLAACDCGASALAPSGGAPPRCDCGEAMWWACPVAGLDAQSGTLTSNGQAKPFGGGTLGYGGADGVTFQPRATTAGGASRFFPTFAGVPNAIHTSTISGSLAERGFDPRAPRYKYSAKASATERHAGCSHLLWARDKDAAFGWRRVARGEWEALPEDQRGQGNVHPTVKSLSLSRWLARLVCPPGGKGGDLFAGSGSIPVAAALEGFSWVAADVSPEAIEIARARLAYFEAQREATRQKHRRRNL